LDPQSHEIVQTIISLAHTLGMTVVAEGIESDQQLAELITMGCEIGQGFYFCKPVGAETAQEMLSQGLRTGGNAAR
jgi:EAL domain-containing protein (putative c-di-GMP-specific phosphodiesterase class I)